MSFQKVYRQLPTTTWRSKNARDHHSFTLLAVEGWSAWENPDRRWKETAEVPARCCRTLEQPYHFREALSWDPSIDRASSEASRHPIKRFMECPRNGNPQGNRLITDSATARFPRCSSFLAPNFIEGLEICFNSRQIAVLNTLVMRLNNHDLFNGEHSLQMSTKVQFQLGIELMKRLFTGKNEVESRKQVSTPQASVDTSSLSMQEVLSLVIGSVKAGKSQQLDAPASDDVKNFSSSTIVKVFVDRSLISSLTLSAAFSRHHHKANETFHLLLALLLWSATDFRRKNLAPSCFWNTIIYDDNTIKYYYRSQK